MTINLPESIADIKLHQFQKYSILLERTDLTPEQFNKRKVEIFTGVERNRLDLISQKDYKEIVEQIDIALNQTVEFKPTFFMEDVEFGFIPNLNKITAGEYRDLSLYGFDVQEMHKLMAVLFRPIKKKDVLGNYSIINYEGTERFAMIMKYIPLSVVNGALVFFSNLANELTSYTQKFMVEEQAKEGPQVTTSKNGDGTQPFSTYVRAKFGI
jgi:hypothetical protein